MGKVHAWPHCANLSINLEQKGTRVFKHNVSAFCRGVEVNEPSLKPTARSWAELVGINRDRGSVPNEHGLGSDGRVNLDLCMQQPALFIAE